MPRPARRNQLEVPANNTVKLPDSLRERIAKAMAQEGFTVWSEFCRVALTEKCAAVERNLRSRDPLEFSRIYPKSVSAAIPLGDGDGRSPR
jgi:hypothetical protein